MRTWPGSSRRSLVDQLVEIDTPLSVARYEPAAVLFVDMIGFTAYCFG